MRDGGAMDFDLQKFSADVKKFRKVNKLTQAEFAIKLDLDNKTLVSLFEQGRRAPSKETFVKYCRITSHHSEDYWKPKEEKTYAFLMEKFAESDKKSLVEVLEKIRMREYLFALHDKLRERNKYQTNL